MLGDPTGTARTSLAVTVSSERPVTSINIRVSSIGEGAFDVGNVANIVGTDAVVDEDSSSSGVGERGMCESGVASSGAGGIGNSVAWIGIPVLVVGRAGGL